jgi:hypothetical protein
MLDVNRSLSLDHKTDQTQPQKERRISVFLPRRQLGLRIRASTPHRRPSSE